MRSGADTNPRKTWSERRLSALESAMNGPRPCAVPAIARLETHSSDRLVPAGPKRTAAQRRRGSGAAKCSGEVRIPGPLPATASAAAPIIATTRSVASTTRPTDGRVRQKGPDVRPMRSDGRKMSAASPLGENQVSHLNQ